MYIYSHLRSFSFICSIDGIEVGISLGPNDGNIVSISVGIETRVMHYFLMRVWVDMCDEILAKNFITDLLTGQQQKQVVFGHNLSELESIDFSDRGGLVLDVCIDECIGNNGEFRISVLIYGDSSKEKKIYEQRTNYSLFHRYPTAQKFFSGVFGVIVSTTVLWGHQLITKCWKYIKYISSVRLLLEEERPEPKVRKDCRHERKIGDKKHGCKKVRRRRAGMKLSKDESSTDEVRKEAKHLFVKSRTLGSCMHDDESLISEQSFEQIYDRDEKDMKSRLFF